MAQLGDGWVNGGDEWINGVMYDRCMGVSNDSFLYMFTRDDMGAEVM